MSLALLNVTGFRNLSVQDFRPAAGFNIVLGDNGSGKSSLLEAIYVLGTGKSFRTHHPQSLMRIGATRFQIYGQLESDGLRLGIERQVSGEQRIQLQGERIQSASLLATAFPVQAMTLNDDQLFDGSPKVRRQFLDWGVFHVEHHQSRVLFQQFQRAIKQRNSALKSGKLTTDEFNIWTQEFIRSAERLHRVRETFFGQLVAAYQTICGSSDAFAFGGKLQLVYSPGWDKKMTLSEALSRPGTQDRERETGLTQVGPHRADIRLLWENMPAKEVLSRGQKKVLAYCLKLAQLQCLLSQGAPKPVILADDLSAELDQYHLLALLQQLSVLRTQVFLTVLDSGQLPDPALWANSLPTGSFFVQDGQLQGQGDKHG